MIFWREGVGFKRALVWPSPSPLALLLAISFTNPTLLCEASVVITIWVCSSPDPISLIELADQITTGHLQLRRSFTADHWKSNARPEQDQLKTNEDQWKSRKAKENLEGLPALPKALVFLISLCCF